MVFKHKNHGVIWAITAALFTLGLYCPAFTSEQLKRLGPFYGLQAFLLGPIGSIAWYANVGLLWAVIANYKTGKTPPLIALILPLLLGPLALQITEIPGSSEYGEVQPGFGMALWLMSLATPLIGFTILEFLPKKPDPPARD